MSRRVIALAVAASIALLAIWYLILWSPQSKSLALARADVTTAAKKEQDAIAITQKGRACGVMPTCTIPACFPSHEQGKRAPGQANNCDKRDDGEDPAVRSWVQSVADNRLKSKAQDPRKNRAGGDYEVVTDDAVSSEW